MFRSTTLADTSRTATETDVIPSGMRKEIKGLYEMILAMMIGHDEDREKFRTFRKEYEIDREKRKGFDNTSFREDIRLLFQRITKLECDLNDIQKRNNHTRLPMKPPRILTRRDCSARNNKLPRYLLIRKRHATDPTRERQPTLRAVLSAIHIFDEYNVPITEFINECHEVQSAVSLQKKANVVILTLRQIARPSTKGAPLSTIY